jgi:hypothetical protein
MPWGRLMMDVICQTLNVYFMWKYVHVSKWWTLCVWVILTGESMYMSKSDERQVSEWSLQVKVSTCQQVMNAKYLSDPYRWKYVMSTSDERYVSEWSLQVKVCTCQQVMNAKYLSDPYRWKYVHVNKWWTQSVWVSLTGESMYISNLPDD